MIGFRMFMFHLTYNEKFKIDYIRGYINIENYKLILQLFILIGKYRYLLESKETQRRDSRVFSNNLIFNSYHLIYIPYFARKISAYSRGVFIKLHLL